MSPLSINNFRKNNDFDCSASFEKGNITLDFLCNNESIIGESAKFSLSYGVFMGLNNKHKYKHKLSSNIKKITELKSETLEEILKNPLFCDLEGLIKKSFDTVDILYKETFRVKKHNKIIIKNIDLKPEYEGISMKIGYKSKIKIAEKKCSIFDKKSQIDSMLAIGNVFKTSSSSVDFKEIDRTNFIEVMRNIGFLTVPLFVLFCFGIQALFTNKLVGGVLLLTSFFIYIILGYNYIKFTFDDDFLDYKIMNKEDIEINDFISGTVKKNISHSVFEVRIIANEVFSYKIKNRNGDEQISKYEFPVSNSIIYKKNLPSLIKGEKLSKYLTGVIKFSDISDRIIPSINIGNNNFTESRIEISIIHPKLKDIVKNIHLNLANIFFDKPVFDKPKKIEKQQKITKQQKIEKPIIKPKKEKEESISNNSFNFLDEENISNLNPAILEQKIDTEKIDFKSNIIKDSLENEKHQNLYKDTKPLPSLEKISKKPIEEKKVEITLSEIKTSENLSTKTSENLSTKTSENFLQPIFKKEEKLIEKEEKIKKDIFSNKGFLD